MLRGLILLTVAAAVAVLPQVAEAADPQAFVTPSKNVMCMSSGGQLRCDMRRLGTELPKKPASCEFDYGQAFGITRNGTRGRRLCVSDAVGRDHPVIGYGRTWRRNGFTCRVRESGLRCTNRGGHGFELRIGRQRLF